MTRNPFEAPATSPATPGNFSSDCGGVHALNAVVGFLFACTGPVAIILTTGARGGLSDPDTSSGIFGAFLRNGFFTIALSLRANFARLTACRAGNAVAHGEKGGLNFLYAAMPTFLPDLGRVQGRTAH